jgi:hypothetical protein
MGWVINATHRPLSSQGWPGTHCVRDWVGPKVGPDGCGKSRRTDRPVLSKLLYGLRCPGPSMQCSSFRVSGCIEQKSCFLWSSEGWIARESYDATKCWCLCKKADRCCGSQLDVLELRLSVFKCICLFLMRLLTITDFPPLMSSIRKLRTTTRVPLHLQ